VFAPAAPDAGGIARQGNTTGRWHGWQRLYPLTSCASSGHRPRGWCARGGSWPWALPPRASWTTPFLTLAGLIDRQRPAP